MKAIPCPSCGEETLALRLYECDDGPVFCTDCEHNYSTDELQKLREDVGFLLTLIGQLEEVESASRSLGGRYPPFMSVYRAENISVEVKRQGDAIVIRLDDETNIDRWEEIEIPVTELQLALSEEVHEDGSDDRSD